MKTIELTHQKVAIVDDEDYPKLAGHTWSAEKRLSDSRHEIWVATRRANSRNVYMHREILELTVNDGTEVLHINGNRLDNRKSNLVVPGHRIVVRNRKFGIGLSRYKGVKNNPSRPGWISVIVIDGRKIYLGSFASEVDAALAYDVVSRKTFGQLATLNFPDVDVRVPPARKVRTLRIGRASRYRGVFWHKYAKKWMVALKIGERMSYLGYYLCEADAARAYDAAIIRHGRDKKNLNFPNDVAFHHPNQNGDEIAGKTPATRTIGIN